MEEVKKKGKLTTELPNYDPTPLIEWMEKKRVSLRRVSFLINNRTDAQASHMWVNYIIKKQRTPSVKLAKAIEQIIAD